MVTADAGHNLVMNATLRPCATAAVALLGAGLICVTPVAAPHITQPTIELTAAETVSDLVGSMDAEFTTGAADGDSLMLLDPEFWQLFWYDLTNPDAGSAAWLLLTEGLEELPVIGPIMLSFGALVFPAILLLGGLWSYISNLFDFPPFAAEATEAIGPDIVIPDLVIPDLDGLLTSLIP